MTLHSFPHLVQMEIGETVPVSVNSNFVVDEDGVLYTIKNGNPIKLFTVQDIPTYIGVKLKLDSDQAITSGSLTNISWDSSDFDTSSFWTNTTPALLTIPITGYYQITVKINYADNTGKQVYVYYNVNDGWVDEILFTNYQNVVGSTYWARAASETFFATQNDVIRVRTFQESGSTLYLNQYDTRVTLSLLGI